jgi:hypothetical protein
VDALISAKYGNATAVAWRRLVSGSGSVDAVAGPVPGGDIVCFQTPIKRAVWRPPMSGVCAGASRTL